MITKEFLREFSFLSVMRIWKILRINVIYEKLLRALFYKKIKQKDYQWVNKWIWNSMQSIIVHEIEIRIIPEPFSPQFLVLLRILHRLWFSLYLIFYTQYVQVPNFQSSASQLRKMDDIDDQYFLESVLLKILWMEDTWIKFQICRRTNLFW